MCVQPYSKHRPHRGRQEIVGGGIIIETSRDTLSDLSTATVLISGIPPVAVSVIYNPTDRTVNVTLGVAGEKKPILSQMVRLDGLSLHVVPYSSENETPPDIPDPKH